MFFKSEEARWLEEDLCQYYKIDDVTNCSADTYHLNRFVLKCSGWPNRDYQYGGYPDVLIELGIRINEHAFHRYLMEQFEAHYVVGPGNWVVYAAKNLDNESLTQNAVKLNGVVFYSDPGAEGVLRISCREKRELEIFFSPNDRWSKVQSIGGLRVMLYTLFNYFDGKPFVYVRRERW